MIIVIILKIIMIIKHKYSEKFLSSWCWQTIFFDLEIDFHVFMLSTLFEYKIIVFHLYSIFIFSMLPKGTFFMLCFVTLKFTFYFQFRQMLYTEYSASFRWVNVTFFRNITILQTEFENKRAMMALYRSPVIIALEDKKVLRKNI